MGTLQSEIVLPKDVKEKIDEWFSETEYSIVGYHNTGEIVEGVHLITVLFGRSIYSIRIFRIGGKLQVSQDNIYNIQIEIKEDDLELFKVILK